jgi:hypothetical protein
MSEMRFQLAYDGPALKKGDMDVRQLAPALLAVGKLIQESNRVLNGERASVEVKVRADFKTASFHIDFNLTQGLLEHARDLLLNQDITDAKEILTRIGFFVGIPSTAVITLLKLVRWLKKRTPDRITLVQISFFGSNILAMV